MRSLSSSEHVVQVPAKAIDSVMHELPPVRFVKIDVEGAESLVLQGMRTLIARDHPIVLLELTDNWLRQLGGSADDVCGSLREAGYILYAIGAGAPTRIDAVPREQIDMLCVTPDIERSLAIGGTLSA